MTNTTYSVTHSNGTKMTTHDTEYEARAAIVAEYGDDCVIHDEWQSCGDDEERLLVWADDESADNDDGSHAVASIRRTTN